MNHTPDAPPSGVTPPGSTIASAPTRRAPIRGFLIIGFFILLLTAYLIGDHSPLRTVLAAPATFADEFADYLLHHAPVAGVRDVQQCPKRPQPHRNAIACVVFERYPSIPDVVSITNHVLNTSPRVRPVETEWRLIGLGALGWFGTTIAVDGRHLELLVDSHPEHPGLGGVLVIAELPWDYR